MTRQATLSFCSQIFFGYQGKLTKRGISFSVAPYIVVVPSLTTKSSGKTKETSSVYTILVAHRGTKRPFQRWRRSVMLRQAPVEVYMALLLPLPKSTRLMTPCIRPCLLQSLVFTFHNRSQCSPPLFFSADCLLLESNIYKKRRSFRGVRCHLSYCSHAKIGKWFYINSRYI